MTDQPTAFRIEITGTFNEYDQFIDGLASIRTERNAIAEKLKAAGSTDVKVSFGEERARQKRTSRAAPIDPVQMADALATEHEGVATDRTTDTAPISSYRGRRAS